MAIYRDTGVFCLSITGTENFQYRPLLLVNLFSLRNLKIVDKLTFTKSISSNSFLISCRYISGFCVTKFRMYSP